MQAIIRREIKSYFYSPIAYVFMGFFMLLTAAYFVATNLMEDSAAFLTVLSNMNFIFMLLVPILTMRLLSEDRKSKTDQMLLTAPLTVTSIVLGKYFAALLVLLITLGISMFYPVLLLTIGSPSFTEIFTGYIGFFLLGASFISIGLFISALVESQVIAAAATFGILFLLYLIHWITPTINSALVVSVLNWLSAPRQFGDFSLGVLALGPVFYYVSFCALFVFLTVRAVESRRWSEG